MICVGIVILVFLFVRCLEMFRVWYAFGRRWVFFVFLRFFRRGRG